MNSFLGLTKRSTWPMQVHCAGQQRLQACILLTLPYLVQETRAGRSKVAVRRSQSCLGKVDGVDVMVRAENLLGVALIPFKAKTLNLPSAGPPTFTFVPERTQLEIHLAVKTL